MNQALEPDEPDEPKVTSSTSKEGIALSADGSKLVAGGIEVNMWKSDGGPTFQSGLADAQFPSSTSQKLRDLAMSPYGNIIVTFPKMVRSVFFFSLLSSSFEKPVFARQQLVSFPSRETHSVNHCCGTSPPS